MRWLGGWRKGVMSAVQPACWGFLGPGWGLAVLWASYFSYVLYHCQIFCFSLFELKRFFYDRGPLRFVLL